MDRCIVEAKGDLGVEDAARLWTCVERRRRRRGKGSATRRLLHSRAEGGVGAIETEVGRLAGGMRAGRTDVAGQGTSTHACSSKHGFFLHNCTRFVFRFWGVGARFSSSPDCWLGSGIFGRWRQRRRHGAVSWALFPRVRGCPTDGGLEGSLQLGRWSNLSTTCFRSR